MATSTLNKEIMSKLIKLTSLTIISSLTGISYYYYVFDKPMYQQSSWYQLKEKVQGIIDKKEDISAEYMTTKSHYITIRPTIEIMKDLWNQQIRNGVEWIYSHGR